MFPLIFLIFQEFVFIVFYFAPFFAFIELYLWSKREKRYKSLNWCHPVPVFVLGYCIVFYQLPFCYLAGFELSYYSQYVLFAPNNITYCVLLAAIGLASFFMGEQFFFLREKKSRPLWFSTLHKGLQLNSYFKRIKFVTRLCLIFSFIFFLLFLKGFGSLSAFMGFAYGDASAKMSPLSAYYQLLYNIFLYLAVLLQIVRLVIIQPASLQSYLRAWDRWVLFVLAVTLVPFLLSGDRGSYLQPLALVAVPYFVLVKPLKFRQAVVIVVCMAFLLVLVGDTRGRTDVSLKGALQARVDQITNPAQWPTMELANSFGTFNIATDYFPDTYPYNYGLGTFYRLVALVPFLSGLSGVDQLNQRNDYVYSSSLFFTNILTHGTFSSGSGTSSLADIYMDFGPWGIPVVMFFWGVFMAWVSLRTRRTLHPVFLFLYAYYSYASIYVNRSSFLLGWNNFLWVFLLFYLVDLFYLKNSIKQVAA